MNYAISVEFYVSNANSYNMIVDAMFDLEVVLCFVVDLVTQQSSNRLIGV